MTPKESNTEEIKAGEEFSVRKVKAHKKATVGDIVYFYPGERKIAGGYTYAAAIVVAVNDGSPGYHLDIQVFSPLGPHYNSFEKNVTHRSKAETDQPFWDWPEEV